MKSRINDITDLWQKWRPRGSRKRLLLLCLSAWFLANSSAIALVLIIPVFGPLSFQEHIAIILQILSGFSWVENWFYFWAWIPLFVVLFIWSALIWLKKPSIFTAAILAVPGMVTGPANYIFWGSIPSLSLLFTLVFLTGAFTAQKLWNNWNHPDLSAEAGGAKLGSADTKNKKLVGARDFTADQISWSITRKPRTHAGQKLMSADRRNAAQKRSACKKRRSCRKMAAEKKLIFLALPG